MSPTPPLPPAYGYWPSGAPKTVALGNLLRQVYSATHPAAHLKRPETPAATARDAAAEAELFDVLATEAEEDNEEEETL